MGKRIISIVPFTEDQRKTLKDIASSYGDELLFLEDADDSRLKEEIKTIDAIIGNVSPDLLTGAEKLTWLQLNSAGVDSYVKPGKVPEKTVITCASGSYGTAISEYMAAMLLVMMKKIPLYLKNQEAGLWRDEGSVASPAGKRILIVGTGDIGLSFARRIKAFELPDHPIRLIGVRRRTDTIPEPLDEIHSLDELPELVKEADVIALSLPGTQATYHLFDRELLSRCKEGSYLINVGRGSVIENEALKDPNVYGRFAGIYIDVCEQEPLPDHDPLFAVLNLYITPHITGFYHLDITLQRIAEITEHNLKAWHGEGEFISRVNRATGYAD